MVGCEQGFNPPKTLNQSADGGQGSGQVPTPEPVLRIGLEVENNFVIVDPYGHLVGGKLNIDGPSVIVIDDTGNYGELKPNLDIEALKHIPPV